jgi:hypothetical protein
MIRRQFLNLLTCAIFTLAIQLSGIQAQAQSLGIAPASVDTKVKPGKSYTQTFTLSNNSGEPMLFKCSVNDYWYDEQNNRVIGKPGTLPRSSSMWIQFVPAEVSVAPNSSATVKAIIAVPQNASGGFYTMCIFDATPANKPSAVSQSTQSNASAAIGVRFRNLMMLTVEGSAEYNVEIMSGQLQPPTSSSPLELSLDIRNRSTTHARVHGEFVIFDAAGKFAGRGKIEGKRYLPNQRNILKVPWAGELSQGHYNMVVTLSYDRLAMEPATLVYELPFDIK